jgi:hypothetical protein
MQAPPEPKYTPPKLMCWREKCTQR